MAKLFKRILIPFREQERSFHIATTYGYARCSTNETRQDIDRQKRELKALGVAEEKYIYWEYESGNKTTRSEFNKLLDLVSTGDTIAATEVSRLTRSTKHLCELLQLIQEKHLRLIIGNFIVDRRSEEIDPITKGMLMMWGMFSEMERDIISQRVKSGMQNAKEKLPSFFLLTSALFPRSVIAQGSTVPLPSLSSVHKQQYS